MEEDKTPTNVTEFSEKEAREKEAREKEAFKDPENEINIKEFSQDIKDEQAPPSLTWKEAKALKRAKYFEIKDKFKQAFILKNKITRQVVEIQAVSSAHACTIIGWKPNRVKVVDVINVTEREAIIHEAMEKANIETQDSSEVENG